MVISCENALSDDEVGIIIMMSTYFMRIPGKDLFANCLSRVNQDLDWRVIGETHLRLLVYNRGHPMEVKELMPYPVWSMEATRSPTWLESLTAYAYEVGEGNTVGRRFTYQALRVVLEPISRNRQQYCFKILGSFNLCPRGAVHRWSMVATLGVPRKSGSIFLGTFDLQVDPLNPRAPAVNVAWECKV